ncbi:hypothetical protein Tco_0151881 [Tanacetum coccineum]
MSVQHQVVGTQPTVIRTDGSSSHDRVGSGSILGAILDGCAFWRGDGALLWGCGVGGGGGADGGAGRFVDGGPECERGARGGGQVRADAQGEGTVEGGVARTGAEQRGEDGGNYRTKRAVNGRRAAKRTSQAGFRTMGGPGGGERVGIPGDYRGGTGGPRGRGGAECARWRAGRGGAGQRRRDREYAVEHGCRVKRTGGGTEGATKGPVMEAGVGGPRGGEGRGEEAGVNTRIQGDVWEGACAEDGHGVAGGSVSKAVRLEQQQRDRGEAGDGGGSGERAGTSEGLAAESGEWARHRSGVRLAGGGGGRCDRCGVRLGGLLPLWAADGWERAWVGAGVVVCGRAQGAGGSSDTLVVGWCGEARHHGVEPARASVEGMRGRGRGWRPRVVGGNVEGWIGAGGLGRGASRSEIEVDRRPA